MNPSEAIDDASAVTPVPRPSDGVARVLAKQGQVARMFAQQDQIARVFAKQDYVARAFAQQDQVARTMARITARQQEAATRIAESAAMPDLMRLRNRLAHFSTDQTEIAHKFAKQHQAVRRLLDQPTRSVDIEAWRYYVRATGTFAAPRDARGKSVVVLTGRDTRHHPYLAGFLREQGWHVVELRPFDQRSAFDPHEVCQDQMLGYERRTDRGQARAPCARDHRLRACSEEVVLCDDLVQQSSRRVEGGACACLAVRLSAGGRHRALHSRMHRVGVRARGMVYRSVRKGDLAARRAPSCGAVRAVGETCLRLG
jgi:hypothetical protein